jgi:cytochrome c-type biogenesis protein CcmI
MFIGALIIAALILILLVGLMRRRTIEGERFQQAVSGELLRKTKLAELEKLRALGKISEEAYRRMREELGD